MPGRNEALRTALEGLVTASAALSCGSSSCPHSRDKGGQMVNGPCRCYTNNLPLMKYVFAASRLRDAVKAALSEDNID